MFAFLSGITLRLFSRPLLRNEDDLHHGAVVHMVQNDADNVASLMWARLSAYR